jgi:hypothetical protein
MHENKKMVSMLLHWHFHSPLIGHICNCPYWSAWISSTIHDPPPGHVPNFSEKEQVIVHATDSNLVENSTTRTHVFFKVCCEGKKKKKYYYYYWIKTPNFGEGAVVVLKTLLSTQLLHPNKE